MAEDAGPGERKMPAPKDEPAMCCCEMNTRLAEARLATPKLGCAEEGRLELICLPTEGTPLP